MKNLTEKTAYWISYLLWRWLAKTGCGYKDDWPGWLKWYKIYGNHFFIVNSWCPLCGFYGTKYRNDKCRECYKRCKTLWFKSIAIASKSIPPCEKPLSIYALWAAAKSPEERKKYATIMSSKFKEIHGGL
jgi:hypothetical protein